jgi:hypothetical protein
VATYFIRKQDENGNTVVIPIKVEICGRGIVTPPPEEKEAQDG